ncbi:MAG: DNA polymerase III subunit gamma/tau [Desulfuromonas sp.]|uniref:DNA polymerase III subunit gamma/tau n=1 Tax=Desulfuromonas sp. TaxID=892 RepID=UPI000CA9ED92|nr:DNA polymerase III subunit gamma/tau [Desulfuromonas sp.]PLX85627.1 MAG: DNA polymerase III subunit gamma/tau [Desulfuromonas sp.]
MSYLVLARKWRPQSFEDLIGQEHVSRTLANAIRTGRVHHAFLFTGARGVGKTSAARILAKALNCEEGLSPTPCNECPSCKEIAAGQGTDVFEIDGASNTGVDDVRDLRENIRYLPSRSRYKLFIIDEVHMLSINAFNALLKTLEEPPEHAKFIFATTEPHKIPVTILSRCQRFDFRKIPLGRVSGRLREIVDAEGVRISDRSLSLVARRGEGSMRDSLSTLDQVIAFCGEDVADDDVQGLLGMVDRRLLLDAVEGVMQRDSRKALETVRRVDELGHSFRQFCQELVETFRALVLVKVLEDPAEHLDATGEEVQGLQALAGASGLEDLQRALGLLVKTEAELAGSAFPRLTLEMALIRLAQLPPAREIAALVRKLEEVEGRLAAGGGYSPVQASARPPAQVSARPPVRQPEAAPPKKTEAPAPEGDGGRGWQGLVEYVRGRRPLVGSMLEGASLLALDLPQLKIGFPAGSFPLEQVKDPETLQALEDLAQEHFGQPVKVLVSPVDAREGDAPPSLLDERLARETDRKKRLREDALDHPMVKAAVDIFGGEVKTVKPIDKGFV